MKFAYLISAHTDAAQLARLIRSLHSDAEFFVHIDKKSDLRSFKAAINAKNVHFIENRTDIRWGTFRQVEYQMSLLEAAINHPIPFDRIFTLSGLDYPLWSNEHITRWIENQGSQELLQGYNITNSVTVQPQKIYTEYRPLFHLLGNYWDGKLSIFCRRMFTVLGIHRPLHLMVDGEQWDLYKGSSWWCITEGLARHIVTTYRKHPEIRRYFFHSFGPDECIIQTIAFNSPEWASRCLLSQGEYPGLDGLTPLHHIVYEPVIQVMQARDVPTLIASGKMFARKFRSGFSDEAIRLIEEQRQKDV